MLETLTVDRFSELIGSTFRFESGDVPAQELRLEEATTHGERPRGPASSRDPFSLIFSGPIGPYLPQGTYSIHHDDLGSLDIFIVPIGPQGDRMQYQAVFS